VPKTAQKDRADMGQKTETRDSLLLLFYYKLWQKYTKFSNSFIVALRNQL